MALGDYMFLNDINSKFETVEKAVLRYFDDCSPEKEHFDSEDGGILAKYKIQINDMQLSVSIIITDSGLIYVNLNKEYNMIKVLYTGYNPSNFDILRSIKDNIDDGINEARYMQEESYCEEESCDENTYENEYEEETDEEEFEEDDQTDYVSNYTENQYYAILGVNEDASKNEIRVAYLKLAKKYHPDVNKTKEAKIKMQEINEAYEALKAG